MNRAYPWLGSPSTSGGLSVLSRDVPAGAAAEPVLPWTAAEQIRSCRTEEIVVPPASEKAVGAGPSVSDVVAAAQSDPVRAQAAADDVGALSRAHDVSPG